MAKANTTPNASAEDPAFEALLADVLNNHEKILDPEITDEQVLLLQKRLNPYSYVSESMNNSTTKKSVAASYTNLREDYIQRFTMTSLVGFLFRMVREWEVPPEDRRWRAARPQKKADPPAMTTEKLSRFAEFINTMAGDMRAAETEAAQISVEIKEKYAELNAAGLLQEEGGSAANEKRAKLEAMLKREEELSAKKFGYQYAIMDEILTCGKKCDEELDALVEANRRYTDVQEIIKRKSVKRAPPNQYEMPAANAKQIIEGFLKTQFEYNPDAHVRSAYDEFVIKARLSEEESGLFDAGDPGRLPLAAIASPPPAYASNSDREICEALTATPQLRSASVAFLKNRPASTALASAASSEESSDRFLRYLEPVPPCSDARPAVDTIPPQDTFHRWKYYTEVNYEELRSATEAIYHEKPDLDWAIILHDVFEGSPEKVAEDFEKFKNDHEDEIQTDVKGLDFGCWTLLGDFKKNRDKISFYNKHTDILKRILDRHSEDKKLGQDLMRNRIRQAKAKNIREDGPDAEGLGEYKTTNPNLSGMGVEKVISQEEMYRIERAKGNLRAAQELKILDQSREVIKTLSEAAKVRTLLPEEEVQLKNAQKDHKMAQEMIQVPDNAIQVDVWTNDTKTGTFNKSEFYTKAEAPEHITKIKKEGALMPFAQEYLNKVDGREGPSGASSSADV